MENDDINNRITDIFAGIYESDTCTSPTDNSIHDESFLDPYGIVITSEDRKQPIKRYNSHADQNWFIERRSKSIEAWPSEYVEYVESKASLEVPSTSRESFDSDERFVMSRYVEESQALHKNESSNGEKSSENSDSAFDEPGNKQRTFVDRTTGAVTYIHVSGQQTGPKKRHKDRSSDYIEPRSPEYVEPISLEYSEPQTDYSPENSTYSTINDHNQYENVASTLPTFYI